MTNHTPIVCQLQSLLEVDSELKDSLIASIKEAARIEATTLDAYFTFLDRMVRLIPTSRSLLPQIMEFYYLIDQSPALKTHELFQQWVAQFAREWGQFLDTPESAEGLATLYTDPTYRIEDYSPAPSGWLTFNQFFARHIRPGKRPIDDLCNDKIIVSPADSVYRGAWEVSESSTITAKGMTFSVLDLLGDSPFRDRFHGGTFTHSFLNVNDYHRYHVPVAGTVVDVRTIRGHMALEVYKKADGSLGVVDGTGYQFFQQRGLLVLETALGLVAILPIGMAQVSSVNITAEVGDSLHKGQEFGYFLFGGSDIITLFECGRATMTAQPGVHYLQGQTIGEVLL